MMSIKFLQEFTYHLNLNSNGLKGSWKIIAVFITDCGNVHAFEHRGDETLKYLLLRK